MRTGGPAAGGEHKEADDDCCTPDRRTLRRGIRPDAGTAGLGGDSRAEGHAAEGIVRGEGAGIVQTQAATGQRHRLDHDARAAAAREHGDGCRQRQDARGAGDWPAREHARHPRRGDRSDRRTA